MTRKRFKRVLIAFPLSRISRIDKMHGIFRYLERKKDWIVTMCTPEITREDLANADGVLITGTAPQSTLKTLGESGKPTVFIAIDSPRRANVAHIETDAGEICKSVVRHFAASGRFGNFALVHGKNQTPFERCCCRILPAEVATLDCTCFMCEERIDWDSVRTPLAIFTTSCDLASRVLADCRKRRLGVPGDVAVIALGKDDVFCENSTPPISSAEPDFEQQGYLAAAELDRLMSARTSVAARTLHVGLKEIVTRGSSDLTLSGTGLVRRALDFIRKNATRPIGVGDVVAEVRVSRRLCELRFREIAGKSIHDAIIDARLDRTRQRLSRTDETIAEVCTKCGWKTENAPKRIFRRRFGMTMTAYRASSRGSSHASSD